MRRVLFPLLVIGLAAGLFTLGSGAFFSDVESDTGNTITAGTLDISLGANAATNCSIAAYQPTSDGDVDFDPTGTIDDCVSSVTNAGSLSGDLWLEITVTNDDNACGEPEQAAGDSTCGPGQGDLGGQLTVTPCTETPSAGTEAGTPCTGTTSLNDLAFSCAKVVTGLPAAATYTIDFDLTDGSVNNMSQSDSVSVVFNYAFVQSGQTPANCTAP